jgi:hypothetical protein
MGRKVRADFLARRPVSRFQLQLKSKAPHDWPPHLHAAWQILKSGQDLSDAKARSVVQESVSIAHRCIVAQNQKSKDIIEQVARTTIRSACSRISKCIKRAPAACRRSLNRAILTLIQQSIIDLDVIEAIFGKAETTFKQFRAHETSRAALPALEDLRKADFSTLNMMLRRKTEDAIVELAVTSNGKRQATAVDVFATIAGVLGSEKTTKVTTQSRDIITRSVAQLAEIWRQAGLKPSRALAYLDDAYRSKFHCFAELILTAMAGPRPKLRRQKIEQVYDDLGDADGIRAAMGRKEYQWLVSDDHVRSALKFKF